MNKPTHGLGMLLVLSIAAPAEAADTETQPSSPYQQVMQAQYAAKAAPVQARPEEAQRIYDAYLRSIGQPVKVPNLNAGSSAGVPSQ
jgi:hypothetical protein